jgi:hypothetical protein
MLAKTIGWRANFQFSKRPQQLMMVDQELAGIARMNLFLSKPILNSGNSLGTRFLKRPGKPVFAGSSHRENVNCFLTIIAPNYGLHFWPIMPLIPGIV